MDEEGFVDIVDRLKDMIISGGKTFIRLRWRMRFYCMMQSQKSL